MLRADSGGSWLAFGYVGRPHGVKGEVHLHAYNSTAETPELLRCPLDVKLKGEETEQVLTLVGLRGSLGKFLLRFQGCESRDHASALVNHTLYLPRECFPPLGPGEFFVDDLQGCEVFDTAGARLGVVTGIFWNGAQDILQVDSGTDEEQLIPVVDRYIHHFEPSSKKVVVALDD